TACSLTATETSRKPRGGSRSTGARCSESSRRDPRASDAPGRGRSEEDVPERHRDARRLARVLADAVQRGRIPNEGSPPEPRRLGAEVAEGADGPDPLAGVTRGA